MANNIDFASVNALRRNILTEVSKAVIGKDEMKDYLLLALIAGGHVLIEGMPGTAKTILAKSFAQSIGVTFKRVQFTPDLMPADITGFYNYSVDETPAFVEGPLFTNILLADELNRTTPRTQSALVEAMEEGQVTVEKSTFPLPSPFMVIATQVQSGEEGTYPLTGVQVDRFLLRLHSSYPTREEEKELLGSVDRLEKAEIKAAAGLQEIKEIQSVARRIYVSPDITEYILSLVSGLREDTNVQSGPSPRGAVALYKCSRVTALFEGRDYVIPDDIKRLSYPALEHRIKVTMEAEMGGITPAVVLERTLENVPVPKLA